MTIEELVVFIEGFDPNLKVGRIGYYGEFYEIDPFDFTERKSLKLGVKVLDIEPPDIGVAPA